LTIFVAHSFLFECSVGPLDLHSFPTRRSSDLQRLGGRAGGGARRAGAGQRDPHAAPPCPRSSPRHGGSMESLTLARGALESMLADRKSTRLNSSHQIISYAVFCLKKKNRA